MSAVNRADVTVGIPTYNRSELLHKAIESVLAQSYPDFTLLVSDNGSTDDTAEVVRSFDDPRIDYRPLAENVGRTANFNRVVDLAQTEFVLILGDDDELRPDHLRRTLEVLEHWPTAGVGHTAYSMTDRFGHCLESRNRPTKGTSPEVFESGAEFIERCMNKDANVCISSAIFRKAAMQGAGGLRAEDGVIDDFPLLLRIARRWDFAYVDEPLALMRAHEGASSSALGWFTPSGFRSSRELPDIFFEHRMDFLAGAELARAERQRLARMARRAHRRDVLSHLSMRSTTGDRAGETFGALRDEIKLDRRLVVDPLTWRFVAGELGGRRVRDGLRTLQHS